MSFPPIWLVFEPYLHRKRYEASLKMYLLGDRLECTGVSFAVCAGEPLSDYPISAGRRCGREAFRSLRRALGNRAAAKRQAWRRA